MVSALRTVILTNIMNMNKLACCCDHNHEHVVAFGRVKVGSKWYTRTSLAAAYPPRLCQQWAGIVAAEL